MITRDHPAMTHQPLTESETKVLRSIERRVLWLATRMIDEANRRPKSEVKVGGHQASCASMVSIMTALWFAHIGGEDKVAIKPHASPVYHAIKYLTGELDQSYLTTLRQRGGLQAYPSRTKDPDVSDFSTGSVGLGAVAPLFSAATRHPPPAATLTPTLVNVRPHGSLPPLATPNWTRAMFGKQSLTQQQLA